METQTLVMAEGAKSDSDFLKEGPVSVRRKFGYIYKGRGGGGGAGV